jgi:aspartate/methionine/tyrosine aminotransferase
MSSIPIFALENYLLQHEYKAEFSLCNSGLDSLTLTELLAVCDSETRTLWEEQSLGYSEPQGHPLLREELAALYQDLPVDSVVTFAGASEAIFCGLQALLSADDHCIVVTPCYQSLKSVPESICATTTVSLQPVAGQWQLDVESIREAIQPNTRVLVMNFPNNPTGALPEQDVLDEIIALAREFDLYIFSDEVYRGLEHPGVAPWPPLVDVYEKGISVGSLSKLYAMPGVRIGWLASCDEAFMDAVTNLKHYTTICNNSSGELLGVMALRAKQEVLSRNRAVLMPRYTLLKDFLEAQADWFEWIPPRAGCLIFPRLKRGLNAERFALELLDEQKVIVVPGQVYDFPGEYLRLSYAGKTLPEALQRLGSFIGQHCLVC